MKISKLRQDKGVAGLTILLSLVTMLFVIGLLVFIFALMGGEIATTDSIIASESGSDTDTSISLTLAQATLTECDASNQGAITSITSVYNETTLLTSGNYTFSACVLDMGTSEYNATSLTNVTYAFSYAGTGWDVVNDTTGSISNVTDWYDIFIVIGAMVVLILLTVIIITAIRGSGLMAGSGNSAGNVGSA